MTGPLRFPVDPLPDAADFDLTAYLRRVGSPRVDGDPLSVLRALCAAQPAHIAFENIDPFLGRPPSLRLADVQAKLVGQRRGGYCHELNLLLWHALHALGLPVVGLAARVLWQQPAGQPLRARSHMLLAVRVEGKGAADTAPGPAPALWLADAGFGGRLMGAPLRLQSGRVQPHATGALRVVECDGEFTIELDRVSAGLGAGPGAGWAPVVRFDLAPQWPVDFDPLNWFTATRPGSLFVHHLMLERLTPAGRVQLFDDRFTEQPTAGPVRQRRLRDADDLAQRLALDFDLAPPVPAQALFDRLPKGPHAAAAPAPAPAALPHGAAAPSTSAGPATP